LRRVGKDGQRLLELRVVISATVGEIHVWYNGTEIISQTGLNVWGMVIPAGYALRLDAFSVFASGVTAVIAVDLKEGDTTVLSAPVTPVADTVTAGAIADASVAAAAELNLTYTTDGSGAGVNLTATIVGELSPA